MRTVLILAGIFYLVLIFILRRKCLIVLSHILVFADEKSSHFSQLLVKLQVPTFIFVSYM